MAPQDPALFWTIVFAAALLPPLLYVIYLRNQEKHFREPWGRVFRAFVFGGIVSVIVALLLTGVVARQVGLLAREYEIVKEGPVTEEEGLSFEQKLILVVIAAPLVEEFAKGLGLVRIRRYIDEPEDGIVYGAAAGLGFSATENLLYEISAIYGDNPDSFLGVVLLRSVTSSFLHATASGILGYGVARRILSGGPFIEVIPFYAVAVLLHAAFNAIAVLEFIGSFFLILFISFFAIRWTVARIRSLDRASARSRFP